MAEHIYIKGPMASGKTTIAWSLKKFFNDRGKTVEHIREMESIRPHRFECDVVIWDGVDPKSENMAPTKTISIEVHNG